MSHPHRETERGEWPHREMERGEPSPAGEVPVGPRPAWGEAGSWVGPSAPQALRNSHT